MRKRKARRNSQIGLRNLDIFTAIKVSSKQGMTSCGSVFDLNKMDKEEKRRERKKTLKCKQ